MSKPITVSAYGKTFNFPADTSVDEIESTLNDNEHLLNPEWKAPDGFTGIAKNVLTGAKQTGRMIGATVDTARNNLSGVEDYARESSVSAEQNMPIEQRKLLGELKEIDRDQGAVGQIGDTLKAAGRNPMGTAQMVVEQLPNTAVSLGGGYAGFKTGAAAGSLFGPVGAAIGGTIGFVSGMFLGNVLLEAGGKAIEKASDEDGFTPQDRDTSLREGAVKAAVITGVDAATFKIGGMLANKMGGSAIQAGAKAETKVLMDAGVDVTSLAAINAALKSSPELYRTAKVAGEKAVLQSLSTGKKAAIIGSGVALETASEGVGEYAGEYAATGKGDVVDATIEALSSATMSVAETAYNYNKVAIGNDLSPEGIKKVADNINERDVNEGVSNINKASSVDEAIKAANDVVSRKPTTSDDVLSSIDPTLKDIERLTGLKPSDAVAQVINGAQQAQDSTQLQSQAKSILSGANVSIQVPQPNEVLNEEEITKQKTGTAKSSGILGKESEIVLPDGTSLPAQWQVVDADSVSASIKEGVNQPRDRTRAASDIQIQGIAKNPDYRRLSDSPVMDVGAPVLSSDGLIVGGNGRFEAISRSHEQGTSADYLAMLRADAANKGIDPAVIDTMKKPVLVRKITQPFDTRKLAIASNSGTSLQYSGLELAKIDADRMAGIEDLDITDSGDIALTGANIERLKMSLGDYSPAELSSLVGKNGELSQDGVKRVRNAMLAKAYGNSETLGRIVESTDGDMRNVLSALTKSAGVVAKARSEISAGAVPKEVDITNSLLDAVETFSQIRAKNQPLENYLAQQSMFGDGIDSNSQEILQFLHDNVRSQKKLTEFIKQVYDQITRIDQTTDNIFGDNSVPSKSEIIQNAKQGTEGQSTEQQQGIFAAKSSEKTGGSYGQESKTQADNAGSGEGSQQDEELKFSRTPEERLKDRERARRLEKKLNGEGYEFSIKAKDVRLGATQNGRGQEAATAERIAKIFRRRVVWIEANGDFRLNGVVVPSIKDTIFIDYRTEKYAHAVIGHELSHHMEHDVPAVYRDMVRALLPMIKDIDAYRAKNALGDDMSDANVVREIVGDIMGDNFTEPAFWNKVAAANPSAFRRIADTVISWLKKLITNAKARGFGSEQWVTDAQKAQDIVAKAVAQYTNQNTSQSNSNQIKFNRSQGWYEFPNAIIAHRSVSDHKDYQAAKDGDFIAAVRLAKDTIPDTYLGDIKQSIGDSNPIVVPVRSAEKSGAANAIPEAVGLQISSKLGIDFDENGIQQMERVGRTGADGWHRIANQPTFEGDVEKGRDYVIVDDTLAQGGTVAQLKEYIENNGGKVSLITALTGKQYSAKIGLSVSTLQLLRDKHGSIEPWFKKSFGYGFEGLTESEARFIISAKGLSSEQVRTRIIEAKRDGTDSDVQGNAKSEVKFSRSSQGSLFGNNNNLSSQEELLKQNSARPGDLFASSNTDTAKPEVEQNNLQEEQNQEDLIPETPAISKQNAPSKIDDFGEKLGGSRKDMEAALRKEYTDADIASVPLSKIWPKEEALSLEDPFMAAFAFAAREEIPTKPKLSYKVKSWVEKVKLFRGLTRLNVSGAITKDKILDFSKNYPGLENFFNKVQLLELIENRKDWSRIDSVAIYPDAYKYDASGIKVSLPYSSFKIDGRTTISNVTDIKELAESVNGALSKDAPEKLMQFEIRGRVGNYFINKKGDKEYRPLAKFTDLKEARAYWKDNYDDLVAAWEMVKDTDNVKKSDIRSDENRPRTGKDWRNGKDVTPEQFQDAFGFRGIEFGNWVSQGAGNRDRQGMLNQAYDALMDLSGIVGIPPKAVSLNGSLGLAFGSRGKGAALAHFESGNLVINLTKTKGAGNLAHEWFHAMDNYFQRQRGVPTGADHKDYFITYKPEPRMVHVSGRSFMTKEQLVKRRAQNPTSGFFKTENWSPDTSHPQGVRPTVERKFADLVNVLDESPMKERAQTIDKNKEDGYWSRIIERAARSFENYVIAKMMKSGYNNDYLANVTNVTDFRRDPGRYPYLLESEIAPVEEAFDNLFSEIKTKETDKGIAMFSRASQIPDTISVNGIDRPTRNSEGKLIHPTEEGIRNFWKWFEESKIVDEQGRPLVVHHGTSKDFSTFNSFANWFSPDIKFASEYAEMRDYYSGSGGATVVPAYIKATSLFDADVLTKGDNNVAYFVTQMAQQAKDNGVSYDDNEIKGLLDILRASAREEESGPSYSPQQFWMENTSFFGKKGSNAIKKLFNVLGFDSIKFTEDGNETFAVFDPNQIKSSIGNNGEFSPDSDDIRFSRWDMPTQDQIKNIEGNIIISGKGEDRVDLYHGTTEENHALIIKEGKITAPVFFTPRKEIAAEYGDGKEYVIKVSIPKKHLKIDFDLPSGSLLNVEEANGYSDNNEFDIDDYLNKGQSIGVEEDVYLNETSYKGKESVGNNSELSSDNDDIRFSVADKNAQKSILNEDNGIGNADIKTTEGVSPERTNSLDIPRESRFRKFQRKYQDSFNRFTVVKEWLADKGINVSQQADVYAAEERYHAKVANQVEDFREQIRNPLIEKIAKAGFTMDDIADYLEAQHAPEANEAIRKLRDDPEATAYGIADDEAKEYLSKAPGELGKLANELRSITEQTKKLRLDGGLLNKDITDAWEATYKHYIPVKGAEQGNSGTGKGMSVKVKNKRRLGHGRRDEAVIENILQDHERAIMEVEKNRVGKHVVMMAAEIGIPELMTIGQPAKRQMLRNTTAYEVQVKGRTKAVFDTKEGANLFRQSLPLTDKKIALSDVVINPTADQRVVMSASPMLADNEINVYIDGHAIRVQINDELMARAYKKLGIEGYGEIVSAGRMLNSYLSKVYTGYNPEFIMTNMVRDFTTGVINLTGEQGLKMAAKAISNYPKSFATLLRYAATNGKQSTDWIDAYRRNGGNTGAAYLSDMERLGNEVASEYAAYQGVIANLKQGDMANAARAAGRKAYNATLKWIYNLNQAGENAMRLSAFKAMIDSGMNVNDAAKAAKNITVNFNRKGELGVEANAAYLFFNASVQGTAATLHALVKGKNKYQAWALASGLTTLGYLAAASLGGGGEDDYDKIDDYTKERNAVIKYGDGYLKLPIPYGYGFFWNIGRSMADAQRKDELHTMPWHIAASAIEELTPFGSIVVGSDGEFKSDQVLGGALPTVAQIPYQISNNKQLFSGGELMPDSPFDQSQPDREKMWRGTKGTMYDQVSGWLAGAGMDVSPETLKFMTRTATGGAGALVDSSVSAAMLKADGAELDSAEMPFIRKAYKEISIKDTRSAFYKAREEAKLAAEEFNRARRKNDLVAMQTVINDKKEMLALDAYADKLSEVIRYARDQQDAVRLNKDIPIAEKRLRLKELEMNESKFYDKYLDVFNINKIEMKKRVNQ